ncbi:MAG: DPP IV N-terminal domain-containing protein, partial [Solirubrobacterales bacterium]
MGFTPDGKGIVLQRMNRRQNRNDVTLADPATGETRVLFSDSDEAWVDAHDDAVRFLADGKRFIWVSERDGWRHAYMASLDGGEPAL